MMQTFRSGRLIVLAAALAACAWFARLAPTDQTVHYVLGDASPRVEELRVRWQEDEPPSRVGDEWLREVSYRFTPGEAPRIVTHEPRLRNGRYAVEIDVVLVGSERSPSVLRRRVELAGGALSINVGSSLPRTGSDEGAGAQADPTKNGGERVQ